MSACTEPSAGGICCRRRSLRGVLLCASCAALLGLLLCQPAWAATWQPVALAASGELTQVTVADSSTAYILSADDSSVLTLDDFLGGWRLVSSRAVPGIAALSAPDSTDLWALTGSSARRSADGGASWSTMYQAPAGFSLRLVSFADALHGCLVADTADGASSVVATSDGGMTWTSTALNAHVIAVEACGASLWAIADRDGSGVIFSSTDGGAGWQERGTYAGARLLALSFASATQGCVSAVSDDGPITLRTADAGASWQSTDGARPLTALCMVSPSQGWGIASGTGDDDVIVSTSDGGSHWQLQDDTGSRLEALAALGGHALSVGDQGSVFAYDGAVPPAATDQQPPTSSVSGADGLWHAKPVTLGFSASDGSSGVDALFARVDGGQVEQLDGAHPGITIPAPADHSGDGSHVVQFRAADLAGNLEQWQAVTVHIDTRPPSAKALYGAGAIPGSTAALQFEVDDPAPVRAGPGQASRSRVSAADWSRPSPSPSARWMSPAPRRSPARCLWASITTRCRPPTAPATPQPAQPEGC